MKGSTVANGAETRASGTARERAYEGLTRDELLDAYRAEGASMHGVNRVVSQLSRLLDSRARIVGQLRI